MKNNRKHKVNHQAEYLTANYTFNELCRFDCAIPSLDVLRRKYRRNKNRLH